MRYLELNVLISQIGNVFTKYNKVIPQIKPHKFTKHLTLVVGDWEFYFDKSNEGFVFSSVVDSAHNDDPELIKIKGYIICDLINNKLINY